MKKFKHLKKNLTWLKLSDGSVYLKRWIYSSNFLKTEIDVINSKIWYQYSKNNDNIITSNKKKIN